MKYLPIISTNEINSGKFIQIDLDYPMFEGDIRKIVLLDSHVIIWVEFLNIFSKKREISQAEFPIEAVDWFIHTIEKKYWAPDKPKKTICEETIIRGEEIGISSMIHCCAENLPGYSFWNKSRVNAISKASPQEWHVPRYMLEEYLLEKLKGII